MSTNPFMRVGVTNSDANQKQMLLGGMMMQQPQRSSSTTTSSTAPPPPAAPGPPKKKRNQPGNPNPDAEVIALSPKTLMATNRFICEVCNKGFQREQNLQLHRRGHNLPWKLKQKTTKEVKRKVYLCPEPSCVHHDPSRALGDLTGIKKHFSRKHGEKKWKCEKCTKRYAVQSDWKAHSKTCGTREYRCDCGTLFSRRDSFITHRAFCDALAQESARRPTNLSSIGSSHHNLYGGNNHLGLALTAQDHHQNRPNILRLGGAASLPPKFEHILSSNNPSSLPMMPSSSFFNDQDHHQQGGLFASKPLQGLINNNNNNSNVSSPTTNLFNLGFFSSSNSNSSTNLVNSSFNNNNIGGVGQGSSTDHILFSNNFQPVGHDHLFATNTSSLLQESMVNTTPHMSATVLLQKAAQIGSTTSNINKSLLQSTTNYHESIESEHQLQGLINSLTNGGNSCLFGGTATYDHNHGINLINNVEEAKLQRSLGLSIGESETMTTLDFLGVGGIVRNMGRGGGNGGGVPSDHHHQQQQHGVNMSNSASLEPEMNLDHGNQQHFGSSGKLQ